MVDYFWGGLLGNLAEECARGSKALGVDRHMRGGGLVCYLVVCVCVCVYCSLPIRGRIHVQISVDP